MFDENRSIKRGRFILTKKLLIFDSEHFSFMIFYYYLIAKILKRKPTSVKIGGSDGLQKTAS